MFIGSPYCSATKGRIKAPEGPFLFKLSAASSSASGGSPTPSSGSVPSSGFFSPSPARYALPVSGGSPALNGVTSPDEPPSSTEGRDKSPTGTSTPGNRTGRARTPSVSVSPPSLSSPSESFSFSPGASSRSTGLLREHGEPESIAVLLNDLNLTPTPSTLGMSDVRDAIAEIADGLERQVSRHRLASPGGRELSLSPRAPRRSRAGSRTSLVPHDVRDEEPPPNRFHDSAVQGAFGDAKALMARLVGVLESSPLHESPDSTIERLHRQTRELSCFECPSTRTVGFVGDSGVGEFLDLFGQSNSGAACTCVVTEYHYHAGRDFFVDVDLFSKEEVMEQTTELLKSYRRFHLHAGNMEEVDGVEEAKEQANVARDTFRAMFRDRLGDGHFLEGNSEQGVLSTMRSWLEQTYPQVGGRHARGGLQECSRLLMSLTSEAAGASEPAVWPYIKKIRVFLDSHILSKGLILVDLPGLRDLNSARRLITERYLLDCDEILSICNIGRATTDVGVESVFELARKAGLSNVGIVCTKSDDIRAEEAKKDWKGPRAARIQQLSDAVASTQGQIDEKSLELAELEDVELTDEDKDEELKLNHEARAPSTTFPLKQYLIETRNASVSTKLLELYRGKVPPGTLRVFCVSNTDYWTSRWLSREEALPSLRLSGIVALRKHCLAIVGDSQLSIATKFVANDIPALLGDVALWIESGAESASAEQKRVVRETLDKVERMLHTSLIGRDSDLGRLGKAINDEFKVRVYDYRRPDEWRESAINASKDWNAHPQVSYSAFCRKYGSHCTPTIKRRDWNEEIIHAMVKDLAPQWDRLHSFTGNSREGVNALIENSVDRALEPLETELEAFPRASEVLTQALHCRSKVIISEAETFFEKFDTSLGTLRIDCLSGIRTSLIGRAMEASYQGCNMEYGSGSDRKRKTIINDAVKHHDLFPKYMRDCKARLEVLAEALQAGLREVIQTHLEVFGVTLDLIRDENVATESEENPELRVCLQREVDAARQQLERMKEIMTS
ncbi:tat pathway signal sequence [Colletotrichum tofieldiae]|uniref:Tat pathway signal sequence n=1 Tax=Colletotrichum tofieldiae TaxID=708197 RepID=A0A161YIN6_9PEZI|nr:tat pathway signal sequence [Colletotrichum tofieldiae]